MSPADRLLREIEGWDDVVDDPHDDWVSPHGIARPRLTEEPRIDGFFDRSVADE